MKIVTDSAADLPAAEAESLGVTVAPLFIIFPDGEVEASTLTPDQFYDKLEAMQPQIPTTAQPSVGVFSELFQGIAQAGHDILSIHISSGLSGTVNSARLAAEQLTGKAASVVDSLSLSGGERFQVLAAARAIKAGWDKEAILKRLDEIRQATEVIYTLDTLTYLARGGRIGRVQSLASALLNIKPIINVDKQDGKYNTVSKARTIKRAVSALGDHLSALYPIDTPVWASVVHGQLEAQADALALQLKSKLNIGKLETLRISPVLGVHTGPGIVGACVVPMRLLEDIV